MFKKLFVHFGRSPSEPTPIDAKEIRAVRLSTGFQRQAMILAGVCALAIFVVAGVAYTNMAHLSQLLSKNTEITTVLRNHQFADMMHDALRAQVYRSMGEGRDHPEKMPGIEKETEDYIAQFQAAVDANVGKDIDEATRVAMERTRDTLSQYIQKTRNVIAVAARDNRAAEIPYKDFLVTFEELEVKLATITDLLQERVHANEMAGQLAQSKALLEITLTLLLAVFFVLWVLHRVGSQLANTLNGLSARLRDTEISTELQAPGHNEIGTLIRAFNAHNLNLRENEERWKFALEGAGDAVWDVDATSGTLEFSPRWWRLLGYTEDIQVRRMPHTDWLDGIHPDDKTGVLSQLRACQSGETPNYYAEYRYRCHDGSWKWIHARGMVLNRDANGAWLRMLGTSSDISERKVLEEKVHSLAYFDVATGLANRSLFSDGVQQALVAAQRESTQLALMFVDLDKFKAVNDGLGHAMGDLLLQQVAQRLKQCIRESDTAGRVGGDEFVILLRTVHSDVGAMQVAEKILHALRQPFHLEGKLANISSSIGVALFPAHGQNEIALFKSADAAMYRAKNSGRDNAQLAQ